MRAIRIGMLVAAIAAAAAGCGSESSDLTVTTAETTAPAAADPPTTEPTDSAVPITSPAPPTATDAPAVTDAPTITTEPATTGTTPLLTSPHPIVAIDGNGDAVIVAADGTKVVLFDGTDPDEPAPSEGEVTSVNGIAVLDDGSLAFVSDCCEPVPGTMYRTVPPAMVSYESGFVGYGNGPSLSPDQTMLVRPVYDAIVVSDLELDEIATVAIDAASQFPYEAVFIDGDTIAVTMFGPEEATLILYDIAGSSLVPGVSAPLAGPAQTPPSFAGVGSGVLYVAGLEANTLAAFDTTTLSANPAANITLPAEPLSAWVSSGEVRWVGSDRVLHIGDTTIPGAFIWVH